MDGTRSFLLSTSAVYDVIFFPAFWFVDLGKGSLVIGSEEIMDMTWN